jgi:hypothetical protein
VHEWGWAAYKKGRPFQAVAKHMPLDLTYERERKCNILLFETIYLSSLVF